MINKKFVDILRPIPDWNIGLLIPKYCRINVLEKRKIVAWFIKCKSVFCRVRLIIVCFLCYSSFAVADDVIYTVKIALEENRFKPEKRAQAQAFRKALVKVSGSSRYSESITLSQAMSIVNRYVSKLSHVGIPNTKDSEYSTPMDPGLLVGFDRRLLLNFAKQNAIPIWSSNRPKLVVVPLIQQWSDEERIMNRYSDERYINMLEFSIEDRGIESDVVAIDPSRGDNTDLNARELWDLNLSSLLAHKQGSDVLYAVIRFVIAQDGKTLASSLWNYRGKETVVNSAGQDIQHAIQQVIYSFIDGFSKPYQFISQLDKVKSADIVLVDVEDFDEYNMVMQKIGRLEMIHRIRPLSVHKNKDKKLEFSLSIDYDSGEQALIDNISRLGNFELSDIQANSSIDSKSDFKDQIFRYFFTIQKEL